MSHAQPPRRGSQPGAAPAKVSADFDTSAPEAIDDERTAAARAYDDFPYEGHAFPLTHPDRIATVATLFGMTPAAPPVARVLELGCGMGGNLIPMASFMPEGEFVGYDLSEVQVRHARARAEALGLRNIEIAQRNLLDVGKDSSGFDYIICHGVFSWVAEEVQEKILWICRENLRENGVALVSYNTYPGWHMRESIRGMMRYHSRQFSDPKVQVTQSRALLEFLARSVNPKDAYGMYLASELALLSRCGDYYIAHEHLELWNTPQYFHQFMERAQRQGLQYLGESEFSSMVVENLAKPVAEKLAQGIDDIVRLEQYMDFVRNRTFRSTLVCHQSRRLVRKVSGGPLAHLYIATTVAPLVGSGEWRTLAREEFKAASGLVFEATGALTRAALRVLTSAWPRTVSFSDLVRDASQLLDLGAPTPRAAQQLAADLLRLYARNAIELRSMPSRFTISVSQRPSTSLLARLEARRGRFVTNFRHESLPLNQIERCLVLLLDGTHDRGEVVRGLEEKVTSGELLLKREGAAIHVAADRRTVLGRFYDKLVPELARKALLLS